MSSEPDLTGKVALVTGAAAGIGRASVKRFVARGAVVAAADLDLEGCRETLALAGGEGGLAIRCDVSDAADVDAMVTATLRELGAIDCFHSNAGISGPRARLDELALEDWDRVIDTNLRGTMLGLRAVLPAMYRAGSGSVVNMASAAGTHGFARLAAYCASKAGTISLTKVAALEGARYGVRVNAIAPGMVETAMGVPPGGALEDHEGPYPVGRLADPDEIASVVVWLCSSEASYINGACLPVDGGWTATLGPSLPKRQTGQTR